MKRVQTSNTARARAYGRELGENPVLRVVRALYGGIDPQGARAEKEETELLQDGAQANWMRWHACLLYDVHVCDRMTR